MKKIWLLVFVMLSVRAMGQIITTFAGTGLTSNTGDGGAATSANIDYPLDGAFDRYNNYYFATGNTGNSIRKISPSGNITTVAGSGIGGYLGDGGPATSAQFRNTQSVGVDTLGNLYVTDNLNHCIRKVNASTGLISTICGNGSSGFAGDGGPASAAKIFGPIGICLDKIGNIYIADYGNQRVRKINTSGIITTFAGGGSGIGDGIPATAAGLNAWGICSDNFGNVYFGDGSKKVYKVDTFGIIHIHAGTSISGYSGDGGPATIAKAQPYYVRMSSSGNLFFSEYNANTIRFVDTLGIINTIVGTYATAGSSGDGGLASSALLNYPAGVNLDSCGNLYICEAHGLRVRKVTYDTSCHFVGGTLSLFNKVLISNISIYPNPTSFLLHIENIPPNATYHMYNMIGAAVQSGNFKEGNNTISIQQLPPGIYLLHLTDDAGLQTVTKIFKR